MAVYVTVERPEPKIDANPVGGMPGGSIVTINDAPSVIWGVNLNRLNFLVHVLPYAGNANETLLGADSHADTRCLGGSALEILDFDTPMNVSGHDLSLGSKSYRLITGAVAYQHPYSGVRYHLIFHVSTRAL